MIFIDYEARIINTLRKFKTHLSIGELAKHGEMTYGTSKKYTEILYKKGILVKKVGKRNYVKFNLKELEENKK